PRDPWVMHLGLLGAQGQHPRERPVRVGPEDHPLLFAVQGEAVVEELRALLAPIAGPVAAGGAEAVEAGKDVECVGGGHDALLECLDGVLAVQKATRVVVSALNSCTAG